jgi:hypothetical protein
MSEGQSDSNESPNKEATAANEIQKEVVLLERLVSVATITGTILTLLGLVIAFSQYSLAKSTALSQTALQAEAVRLTTLATRPWIHTTSVLGGDEQNPNAVATVGYRNSGPTPSLVMPIVYAKLFPKPLSPSELTENLKFDVELSMRAPTGESIYVVPGNTENQEAKRIPKQYFMPGDLIDVDGKSDIKSLKIASEKLRVDTLYIWGAVLYEDGLHQEHEVKFCYEHRPGDQVLFACTVMNMLDETISPSNADCVTPQSGDKRPLTHSLPCKQVNN